MYLVSVELLARGGSGTQGKISDTAKRKQLVGFIVIMVIGTFGGDVVLVVMTTAREVSKSVCCRCQFPKFSMRNDGNRMHALCPCYPWVTPGTAAHAIRMPDLRGIVFVLRHRVRCSTASSPHWAARAPAAF